MKEKGYLGGGRGVGDEIEGVSGGGREGGEIEGVPAGQQLVTNTRNDVVTRAGASGGFNHETQHRSTLKAEVRHEGPHQAPGDLPNYPGVGAPPPHQLPLKVSSRVKRTSLPLQCPGTLSSLHKPPKTHQTEKKNSVHLSEIPPTILNRKSLTFILAVFEED